MWSCTKEARRKILHKDEASAIIIARLVLGLEESHKPGTYDEVKSHHIKALKALRRWVMKPFLEGVMKRFAVLTLLLMISLPLAANVLSNDMIAARVISVTDGDNLTVIGSDNKQALIRLHGIDCPELAQPFGENAKEFTSNLCFGKIIMYRMVGIDRFDRTIATVFLEDGKELNLAILKAGLAWRYERYAKRQDYADAEEEARRAGIGLWGDKEPMPPWEWRREKRKKP
jgi:endonuclease YncB( thermonuclease family)